MFLIHERKFESVHTVLFQVAVDIIPGLLNAKNVIIVSDEEKAIVNSITKVMPNIKSFRCWLHAYQNIKRKLQKLGIRRKEDVKEYKNDFIRLLTQKSKVEYKSILADFYLKKWNKVYQIIYIFSFYPYPSKLICSQDFSDYYSRNIDPDIDRMGSWVLLPFGFELLTTNQSESMNCFLKRFTDWTKTQLDMFIIILLKITEYFEVKVMRSRYMAEQSTDYNLLDHLIKNSNYALGSVSLPKPISREDLIARIKMTRPVKHLHDEVCMIMYT